MKKPNYKFVGAYSARLGEKYYAEAIAGDSEIDIFAALLVKARNFGAMGGTWSLRMFQAESAPKAVLKLLK